MSDSFSGVAPAVYTVPETSNVIKISTRKVWRMLSQGVFTRIIVGAKGTRILVSEVEAYIESLTAKAKAGVR